MQIRVTRFNHDTESSMSLVAINKAGRGSKEAEFFCFGLEDERRDVKLRGETRIWEGEYKLAYQELLTEKTKEYRKRYDWFDKFLHIKDVPEFTGIYIHIGNTDKDTLGCLLLGYDAYTDSKDFNSKIGRSTDATRDFYKIVCEALDDGEEVTILYQSIL